MPSITAPRLLALISLMTDLFVASSSEYHRYKDSLPQIASTT